MGNLCDSCFGNQREELIEDIDPETRRQQALEAAERRRQETENRGIKDPEKVKRMEERSRRLEQMEIEAAKKGMGQAELRWTQD
ncbi:small VCP/p97-interacting protein [Culicoides brevitarsis]|uniref:small VCP/p97-interacting protein n=1 Tax=Culicoides brevitarsis TaxID=469753 RepID=UPI00307B28C2